MSKNRVALGDRIEAPDILVGKPQGLAVSSLPVVYLDVGRAILYIDKIVVRLQPAYLAKLLGTSALPADIV